MRELIANPATIEQIDAGIEKVPDSGWRKLSDDDNTVVFGNGEPLDEESGGIVEITMTRDGDGYALFNSVHGCTPRAHVPGRNVVEFVIAKGVELSSEGTEVEVLVNETACTGGMRVDERLGTPQFRYGPDSIEVLLTAMPPEGEFFTCQGNPASSMTLHFDEPVGDRHILDLSSYPPADASDPRAERANCGWLTRRASASAGVWGRVATELCTRPYVAVH